MEKADEVFEDAAKVLGYMVLIPCETFYKRVPLSNVKESKGCDSLPHQR